MVHITLTVNSALLHGPCIRCLSSPQLSEVDVVVSSISVALERPDTWLPLLGPSPRLPLPESEGRGTEHHLLLDSGCSSSPSSAL